MDKIINTIQPQAPFNFDLTAGYHTYFRGSYGSDSLDNGTYQRLLDLGDRLVLASVRSVGTVEVPELTVEIQGDKVSADDAAAATEQVAWVLGTNQDLAPFYNMVSTDPVMSQVVNRFHGLHLPHTASVWEALVLAVLGQQIATGVARIIRTLLIETYGSRRQFDGKNYFSFPRPDALELATIEELRHLKLSQRKAEYVLGIAQAACDSTGIMESLQDLSDQEVVQRVTEIRGVGKWTAQWVLVRGLGRPDALPLGDLALRRIVSSLYFEGNVINDTQLDEFALHWSPWRTYATVYLFTALRSGMG